MKLQKIKPVIYAIIILIILLAISVFSYLIVHEINKPATPTIIQSSSDTTYVPKIITVYRPGKTIYLDTVIYKPIPTIIDTNAILTDYYAERVYVDSLYLADSLGFVATTDTISKNQIVGRVWNAKINQKIITNNIIVEKPQVTEWYLGMNTSLNSSKYIGYTGSSILIKPKKSNILYSLGLGYDPSVNSVAGQIGIYWKITMKSK